MEKQVEEFKLTPKTASIEDLAFAADWLGCYETSDMETVQSLTNAIGFLMQQISTKQRKVIINEAKRNYAKENGVKFSQVRLSKKEVA